MPCPLLSYGAVSEDPSDDQERQADSPDSEETEMPLTPSIAFGLLSARRDRFLLYLLYERGGTIPLTEVTEQLAALENETSTDLLMEDLKTRVRTSLEHATLPKLVEHDLVTYERESEAVTLSPRGEQLEPYLEFAKEREHEEVRTFLREAERDR